MSSRRGPSGAAPPTQGRQNEYFVPRDGIDREVITADICRYLGNDALVRPGTYEEPNSGQLIQGYYINAYRNLTTAMIEDLKADSARWDQERRQQSSRHAAGVQYRNSETHSSRQYYGPTESGSGFSEPPRDPYSDSAPRYPGTGSGNYTGVSSGLSQQFPSQGGFGAPQGYTTAQPSQFASPSGNYPGHSAMPGSGFGHAGQDSPYIATGANNVVRDPRGADQPMYTNDPYSTGSRDHRGVVPVTSMPASRTTAYATSGSVSQGDYQSTGYGGGSYPQPASTAAPSFAPVQPQDPFYGRRPYSQEPQYDSTPAPSRTPTGSSNAQILPSGSSSRHRDTRDRDSGDRHADSRHGHRHRSNRG